MVDPVSRPQGAGAPPHALTVAGRQLESLPGGGFIVGFKGKGQDPHAGRTAPYRHADLSEINRAHRGLPELMAGRRHPVIRGGEAGLPSNTRGVGFVVWTGEDGKPVAAVVESRGGYPELNPADAQALLARLHQNVLNGNIPANTQVRGFIGMR